MPLTGKERSALVAQSHPLKPVARDVAGEVGDAFIAEVRRALDKDPLIKIRLDAQTGAECEQAARRVAEQADCEFVRRIGRVAVLFRMPDETSEPPDPTR